VPLISVFCSLQADTNEIIDIRGGAKVTAASQRRQMLFVTDCIKRERFKLPLNVLTK